MQPTPPGWYLDPYGRPALWRWFTGRVWTGHVSADPRAASPEPPPRLEPDPDGRVRAGGLTFPVLPEPWRPAPPYLDLDDEVGQERVVAASGRGPYVACVFLGRLPWRIAYDGPQDLATAGEALTDELLHTYYPHEQVRARTDRADPLVGRPAWRAELGLDVSDPHLELTREEALVALVDSGDGAPGVVYASLPVAGDVPGIGDVLDRLGT